MVRLTFRAKLMVIVGVAAVAFLLVIATGTVIASRVSTQLETIQTRYLPKVQLQDQLDADFERLRRGFQDAVASRDPELLAGTRTLKAAFLRRLAVAGAAVDPADAAALGASLEDYDSSARELSERLVAGETGEALVGAMSAMQTKQGRVTQAIHRAAAFDRADLAKAFAAAARAESDARSLQLAISVTCLFIVLIISLGLSSGVLRAMAELSQGLERFGRGDFGRSVVVAGHDELGVLAEQANRMAANLKTASAERERAERELLLANKELEAFSYSVAHDLRAPLRGINGFSRALVEDWSDRLDGEAKDYLDRIAGGAQRMGELIDALLSLSRVARAELQHVTVDLSAMANGIVSQLRQGEPQRDVDFANQPGGTAMGDPILLRAVLENLLGNAWKFTSRCEQARIAFGWEAGRGAREYYVRDNGAGFDMAYAAKLFAPFQRLHTVAEYAGTGIGLATVQRIVHRHGGRIWAEGAVGKGATFRFTLPESEGATS